MPGDTFKTTDTQTKSLEQQNLDTDTQALNAELDQFESPGASLADIPAVFSSKSLPIGLPTLEEAEYFRDSEPDVVIIGARPGGGKSAMLCQLAYNLALHAPVHMFSLEMSAGQLKSRLMSHAAEKPIRQLKSSRLALDLANRDLKTRKLYIDDTNGLSINDLYARAVAYHKRHGTKAVFVDYLQIINTNKGNTRADQVGHISQMLKQLAKELKCPVIAAAQLNRNIEGRVANAKRKEDVFPIMSDIAESSKIEAWADVVMVLQRQFINGQPDSSRIGGYILKNRHGPPRDFKLEFKGDIFKFIDRGADETSI